MSPDLRVETRNGSPHRALIGLRRRRGAVSPSERSGAPVGLDPGLVDEHQPLAPEKPPDRVAACRNPLYRPQILKPISTCHALLLPINFLEAVPAVRPIE